MGIFQNANRRRNQDELQSILAEIRENGTKWSADEIHDLRRMVLWLNRHVALAEVVPGTFDDVLATIPHSKTFDINGREHTYHFTEAERVTAAREEIARRTERRKAYRPVVPPEVRPDLGDDDTPPWKHVEELFASHGVECPGELRDELSIILMWARYGRRLADPAIEPRAAGPT